MVVRALFGLLVIAVLGGLVIYSQFRTEVDHVSGFVEAEDVRLGSRVGGRVAEVLAEEGDQVTTGQLLVRLEPFDLLEERARAEAELEAREAELEKLQAGLRKEEVAQAKARYEQALADLKKLQRGPRPQEIAAARSRLEKAESELVYAERNLSRIEALVRRNASTQDELDQATEKVSQARNEKDVRQQELDLLEIGSREEDIQAAAARAEEAHQALEQAQAGFRKEEIAQAKAARDAAKAALAAIVKRIDELQINSPVNGVIEALDLEPGDLVPANAPFMSVLDTSKYWVRAYVPQRRMDLKTGQHVRVTVDSFPDREFEAELTFVAREAEFTPSNVQTPEDREKLVYRIKAQFLKHPEGLRPGVTADVWLDAPTEK